MNTPQTAQEWAFMLLAQSCITKQKPISEAKKSNSKKERNFNRHFKEGDSNRAYSLLLEAFDHLDEYKVYKKKKQSGGYRTISEPHKVVTLVQRRILKNFLYRFQKRYDFYRLSSKGRDLAWLVFHEKALEHYIDPNIHGMLKKHSVRTAAQAHCYANSQFVLKVDLKDAFPSVKMKPLKKVLYQCIFDDCKAAFVTYQRKYSDQKHKANKNNFIRYSFFPGYRFPEFRSFIRDEAKKVIQFEDSAVIPIIGYFTDYLCRVCCFKGLLPQGAPTSGFLLNMVISETDLLYKIRMINDVDRVSIYVDDLIISTKKKPDPHFICSIIDLISETNVFVYNPKKVRVYDLRKGSAFVLGMKIVNRAANASDMERLMNDEQPRGLIKALKKKRPWKVTHLTLSRKKQKQYRAFLHKMNKGIGTSEEMKQAVGCIGHIVSVYGWPHTLMPAALRNVVKTFRDLYFKHKAVS